MKKFTGLCLITPDVLRLSAFYRDLLEVEMQGDQVHAELATQGAGLYVFAENGMEQMAPRSMQGAGHGSFTIEFQVEDVDSEHERLLKMGVPIVKPPTTYPWGRRAVWFRDPDGNIVNFYSQLSSDPPAIVFDFGGVLIDWDPRYLYRKVFHHDEQAVERFLSEVGFFEWNRLQDAGRPFSEAIADLCARQPQYCDLIRLYDERYAESIGGPIPLSVEILGRLHAAGYHLYGLSNWPAEKFQVVRPMYEFFNWFDAILISGEVHLAKPDPRFFALLLDQVARPAAECLLIDDSTKNILAAQSLGFRTILFQSPQQLQEQLRLLGLLP